MHISNIIKQGQKFEQSEMDEEIRINMLTLCKFVDKHTIGALIDPTDENMSTLIDLNRNIALGLLNIPENNVGNLAAQQDQNLTDTQQEAAPDDGENSQLQKVEITV